MKSLVIFLIFIISCVRLNDFKKAGAEDLLIGRFVGEYKKTLVSGTSGTEATFQIQGTLKDSSGNPIANATLTMGVSQNVISKEAVTTSTTTDANGNYALNLRVGNFSIKVTNSSGVEVGTFRISTTTTTDKPSITITSGSIAVVVNSVGAPSTITPTTVAALPKVKLYGVISDNASEILKLKFEKISKVDNSINDTSINIGGSTNFIDILLNISKYKVNVNTDVYTSGFLTGEKNVGSFEIEIIENSNTPIVTNKTTNLSLTRLAQSSIDFSPIIINEINGLKFSQIYFRINWSDSKTLCEKYGWRLANKNDLDIFSASNLYQNEFSPSWSKSGSIVGKEVTFFPSYWVVNEEPGVSVAAYKYLFPNPATAGPFYTLITKTNLLEMRCVK